MKDKISKIKSVYKKYGFFKTIKKIFNYLYSTVFIRFNLILYIKTMLGMPKYKSLITKIINDNDINRIIIWRSEFGWNIPLYQRPQHIASQIRKLNSLVLYEVTKMTDKVDTIKKQDDNLYLVNFKNKLIFKWIINEINKRQIPKYIQFYSTDWHMNRQEIQNYIDMGFKIIYEYIDDLNPALAGTKDLPVNVKEKYEMAMKNDKDIFVVVTADELEKDVIKKRGNKKLVFSCNGVDYDFFQRLDNNYKFDNDFEQIVKQNKPIIGYYGALASWFDYDMLKYLAENRKDYNIVLFGIKYDDSFDKQKLDKYKNIHFLGSRDYKVLKNYATKFSVCTIPFLINDITKATSPVKLFEYMALHKPIVTTAMHECKKYKSVMIANNKEQFVKLIDTAVNMDLKTDKKYFDLLDKEALENTWEQKAISIVELLKKYEK